MRRHHKKNLPERMERVSEFILAVESQEYFALDKTERKRIIDIENLFGNTNPLEMELGAGKGGFAVETAKRNPLVNLIAVEKISDVIVCGAESCANEKLNNLKFLNISVENLLDYIMPHTVKTLYLNFSCPYPKQGYANRRLTNPKFIKIYKELLAPDGVIIQKTDNQGFFEYSLESFSNCGCILSAISLDLHNSKYQTDNVETEYEKKFSAMGKPIYRLEARFEK